jgi:hypothetical protein
MDTSRKKGWEGDGGMTRAHCFKKTADRKKYLGKEEQQAPKDHYEKQ